MIQKRYQIYGSNGIEWTEWFNYATDNNLLAYFNTAEKWQLKNKLLNEFRIK